MDFTNFKPLNNGIKSTIEVPKRYTINIDNNIITVKDNENENIEAKITSNPTNYEKWINKMKSMYKPYLIHDVKRSSELR